MKRREVAILGASGLVGQKAYELLKQSNDLRLVEIATSKKHVGSSFCGLVAQDPLTLRAPYILSALPKEVALTLEPLLLAKGHHIFSNASAFRMQEDVPLLIPEVNLFHLPVIKRQMTPGKLICNPNCMVALLAPLLAPVIPHLTYLHIVTLQAISGAGKDFTLENNMIPNIAEEEHKIVIELQKILGPYSFPINVHTHRIPVLHGHSAILDLHFAHASDATALLSHYQQKKELFQLYDDPFSPQPGRDLTPLDQKIHIGRIKQRGNQLSFIAMNHNLVRGAALGSILNLRAFLEFSC